EQLDDRRLLGHVAELVEQLGGDDRAGLEVVEAPDVDAVDLDPVDVDEAALGDPPVDRQLPALEPGGDRVALARALGSAARGLAGARAGTAADPLFGFAGALRRLQRVKFSTHRELSFSQLLSWLRPPPRR